MRRLLFSLRRQGSSLLRARYGRFRQHGFIRETECAVNCIRRCPHLKPLQQWNVLRVIGEVELSFLHGDWRRSVGQNLDGVPLFKIVLTNLGVGRLARELPDRGCVVNERIGKRFGEFMGKGGYVLEPCAEKARQDQLKYWLTQRGCGIVLESRK